MFKVDDDSPLLSEQKLEMFHTFLMKGMFLVKRVRPDLEPGFGVLSSRVRASTKQDWSKLVKLMSLMLGTNEEVLTLSADESKNLHWRTDAAFGVHSYMKNHTDGKFSMVHVAMS